MGIRLSTALVVALALGTGCGPKTLQARMEAAERRGDRATAMMDDAQRALDALEPERAQDRLRDAKEQLWDREMEANPEAGLLRSRYAELEARLPEVRARKAQEELAKKVAERKQVIGASLSKLRAAVAELKPGVTDRAVLRAAREGIRKVRDDIAWKKELQTEDPAFGQYVEGLGVELESTELKIDVAEKAAAFVEGPGRALESAGALADKAKAEPQLAERLKLQNDSLAQYRACAEAAKKQLTEDPGLERTQVMLGGKLTATPDVRKACEAGLTAQQKLAAATQKELDREAKRQALADAKAKKAAEAKARKTKKGTAKASP